MKFKIKEGHAGVMVLKDGSRHNFGVIRISKDLTFMIYHTGKGLREIFKSDMTSQEIEIAEALKKLTEEELIKTGHIAKIYFKDIVSMS